MLYYWIHRLYHGDLRREYKLSKKNIVNINIENKYFNKVNSIISSDELLYFRNPQYSNLYKSSQNLLHFSQVWRPTVQIAPKPKAATWETSPLLNSSRFLYANSNPKTPPNFCFISSSVNRFHFLKRRIRSIWVKTQINMNLKDAE